MKTIPTLPKPTSDAELVDLVTRADRVRNSLDAQQAAHMLTYVDNARVAGERLAGERAGRLETSAAAHELSLALKLPVGTVESTLAMARRVRSTMATVWAGWHGGDISTHKIRLIDQAAARLTYPTSISDLDVAAAEKAPAKTPGQLRSWLDRFIENLEAGAAAERHRRAVKDRRVWVQPAGDGMSWVTALIPTLAAAAIDARLDATARTMPSSDPRTHEQKRADIFTEALLGTATDGAKSSSGAPSTTIGVIVPIQSLMGLSDAPGELADRSASVPASLIRSHAVQPGTLFWRLITDKTGNLLDAKKMGRFATGNLGQAIRFRDGTSVFPTSVVPAERCDIDHSEAWPAPTTAANLGPLHRKAHSLKTEGLLSVRQPEPGTFIWETRTGHTYQHRADPLPVTQWEQPDAFTPEYLAVLAAMPPPPDDDAPPDHDLAA